jgi:septal ring factor EnvC (AmiA/AmiB activator)
MEEMQESINKDLKELKNKHAETNNTITEIKNTLEEPIAEYLKQKNKISELEDKMVEITSEEQNKVKRMKRTEDSLRDLWENIRAPTLNYRGPRRREKERV